MNAVTYVTVCSAKSTQKETLKIEKDNNCKLIARGCRSNNSPINPSSCHLDVKRSRNIFYLSPRTNPRVIRASERLTAIRRHSAASFRITSFFQAFVFKNFINSNFRHTLQRCK